MGQPGDQCLEDEDCDQVPGKYTFKNGMSADSLLFETL